MFTKLTFACLLGLVIGFFTHTYGAEQRCSDLGANCVCSEPLNTNSGPKVGSSWYNPADSTTKECAGENGNGAVVTRNAEAPLFTNDSAALAAMPTGKTVNFVMRGANGHVGIFFINNGRQFSAPYPKRYSVRFYRFYSSNYELKGDGLCQNSKLTEVVGPGHPHGDNGQGNLGWYDFTGYSPIAPDCCYTGPGNNHNFTKAEWKGVWHRHEIVVVNPAGGGVGNGLYWVHYVKNVTTNGPEYVAADSRITGSLLGNTLSIGLTPPSPWTSIAANNYRQGTCNGYSAWSHYMVASWNTDAGQRIGAAYEIESGAGGPPPPPPPPAPTGPTGLIIQAP